MTNRPGPRPTPVGELPWCRVRVVEADGTAGSPRILAGEGLVAVDRLARVALEARRRGARVEVEELSPTLGELLELAGLRLEVGGQAVDGEEGVGVQEIEEEVHPGDPPV